MVTDSIARTFFLLLMIFVIFWPKVWDFQEKSSGNTVSNHGKLLGNQGS